MLNHICHVQTSAASGGHLVFDLTEPVQRELNLFHLTQHSEKIVKMKACPSCNSLAVSMLVGLVYSAPKLILQDVQVTYCLQEKSVYLAFDELANEEGRRRSLSSGDFTKVSINRVGVGNRILEPLLGEDIKSALSIGEGDSLFYSTAANAISFAPSASHGWMDARPDAIAFHSSGLPETMSLKFEPTTRCNFKCEFCYGRHLAQGDLTYDDFLAILDRMPYIKAVELTGEGEPLLNIHILDMLSRCNERGVWTHITTNASMLKEERCRKMLKAGVDSVAISLEAFKAEQFETLRIGGHFEKVVDGIRNLARLRGEREKPMELRLWVTLLRDTYSQVDDITAFAEEVGIDSVEYQSLNSMSSYSRFYTPELQRNILTLPEMKEIADDPATSPTLRNALLDIISVYQGRRCDIFMSTIMANWQGEVTPCCMLKAPDFQSFGNLNVDTLETLWNGEDYRFFRFALQHGVILESCRECPDVASF